MTQILVFLSGKKTYLIAAGILAYQFLGHYLYGTPLDLNAILTALGLSTLRAGISKV